MAKKEPWEIEREQRIAAQAKAIAGLTDKQKEAVDKAFSALGGALSTIKDCNDLYMSDISAMDTAWWSLYHAFNKENDNA